MPPSLYILSRLVAVHTLAPWEPPTMHFPIKVKEERMSPISCLGCPLTDIFIVLTINDRGKGKFRLIEQLRRSIVVRRPIYKRDISSLPNRLILRFLKIEHLITANVTTVPPWLTPMEDGDLFPCVIFKNVDRRGIPRRISYPIIATPNTGSPVNSFFCL